MSDVTQILQQIESGDPSATEQLLTLVYGELRRLAAARMAQEAPDHTLQATALVHEAYLRLVDADRPTAWDSRGHFFAAAAEAMRRILVESARRKRSLKHGGHLNRSDANLDAVAAFDGSSEVLAINEALSRLADEYPAVAQLVELKYFAGLTVDEAARTMEISARTAHRYWAYARAWLHKEVDELRNDSSAELP